MTDLRVIFPTATGGVAIAIPAPEYKGSMEDFIKAVVPAGTEYKVIPVTEVPSDRTFRDAWEYSAAA